MKIKIIVLAITLIGSMVSAQNISSSKVPLAVTSRFYMLYYNCKPKQWKMERKNYETEFTQNKTEMRIVIDPKGNVIKTITFLDLSNLPSLITNYVATNFPNQKITGALRINEPGGKVIYETKVNKVHVYFDEGGKFIKSEK